MLSSTINDGTAFLRDVCLEMPVRKIFAIFAVFR